MSDTIPFPACAKDCGIVKILGAGECEYCCPLKFDKDGNPISQASTEADNARTP